MTEHDSQLKPATRRALGRALLDWYGAHQRSLPWRKTHDPYHVWVSEIMLQQTQVATVLPYYERWMKRFPTLQALASAPESDVLHCWQGLGYYSRARNLLAAAKHVQREHGGRIPDDVNALLELPGIGRYSAGAIASIAYERPAPIVDGNVTRVLCRLFALAGDPSRAPLKHELWELAERLIPEGRARHFNQALMELGALTCTPQNPACSACPLSNLCAAKREGRVDSLPEIPKRPGATKVHMVAAVAVWRGRVLLTQLAQDAPRWAGMWQFPNTQVRSEESAARALERVAADVGRVSVRRAALWTTVRHSVTRYRIRLDAYRCEVVASKGSARAPNAWLLPSELGALAMPAAHRRLAERLEE